MAISLLATLAILVLCGDCETSMTEEAVAGENWEARLGRLIEAADTVVFVISWEVEHIVTLKKRLLPIVWRRVDDEQVPPRLKQLNYIFFDPAFTFVALQKLARR